MCECKVEKPRFLSGLESEDLPNSFLETHFGSGEFSKTDKVNRFFYIETIFRLIKV